MAPPFRTNLLKNWNAAGVLEDWDILENGGDGFKVEHDCIGSKPLSSVKAIRDCSHCWATSHGWCKKKQTVDLLACGFSAETLDRDKPQIKIKDWVAARVDCPSEFVICVKLLSANQTELAKYEATEYLEGDDWQQIKHKFKNYPAGVRYIELMHGGKDKKFWAGHFGAKMAATSVVLKK